MTLRFVRLDIHEVRIPFRFSFRHSLAERSEAHNLILALTTDSGHVGYGEVLPRDYLTGETIVSAWDDITHIWWPRLKELRFDDRQPVRTVLQKEAGVAPGEWALKPGTTRDFFDTLRPLYDDADHAGHTAGWSGVDVAAVDAWARATGREGGRIFGQPLASAPLTAPLDAGSVGHVRRRARLLHWLGFRHFKLKVGGANDHTRVAAARKAIGGKCNLRVDANAAWSPEQAIAMLRRWKAYRVTSVEQPIPAAPPRERTVASVADVAEGLARVQRESGIPVMADESLCVRGDADCLGRHHAAKLWNVRLAKVGGFSGMLEMIRLAREHFAQLHLGVLVGETSCLAAAQRACLGLTDFAHVEYGFPRVLLKGDPFRGGPGGYFGQGAPLRRTPGLGVSLLPGALRRVTVCHEALE